eukprot:TRINITY_DN4839_c0_g1_i1.p1 TRINITY_DN4839_c0_g1~~TRINITY_DN4839_c0_g1_i1.p1  ORF type:complete len:755 (+),score=127.75 TRINITY_DN4839_c0_g1_i1:101-2266(+)
MEAFVVDGNRLTGPVRGIVQANGDIVYEHGFTSRKEECSAPGRKREWCIDGNLAVAQRKARQWELNAELNSVARDTDDSFRARALVQQGADVHSTNSQTFRHTPLHQAAFHGRLEMVKTLIELGSPLDLCSNPCGRGENGTPAELARGGGHNAVAEVIEKAVFRASIAGHYFSFLTGGDPAQVVDRFEARVEGDIVRLFRNKDPCCTDHVDSASARAMEAFTISGNHLQGPVDGFVQPNGDVTYSHGYTARKEKAHVCEHESKRRRGATWESRGEVCNLNKMLPIQWELNSELNYLARNTDDTDRVRALVQQGADISSTNGKQFRHTPLHQAAFHGRLEMARTLVELGAPLHVHSNPCGRGETGTPLELARGGLHHAVAEMLEKAINQEKASAKELMSPVLSGVHAPQLVLVRKGSSRQCVLEHAEMLATGSGSVPLTVISPAGEALAIISRKEFSHKQFHIMSLGVGDPSAAVCASFKDGFLTCEDNGYVLDVQHWIYQVENPVLMLKQGDDAAEPKTRNPSGGRSFKVNLPDGTVSPMWADDLVLGVAIPRLVLVQRDSPNKCLFENAEVLRKGTLAPLVVLSPGEGKLAVVPETEEPYGANSIKYIPLRLGQRSDAVVASFDGTYIEREKMISTTTVKSANGVVRYNRETVHEMVFDVAWGDLKAGSFVNMVHQRLEGEPIKQPRFVGRHFEINEDGTISPASEPELVLGLESTCEST